MRFTQAVLVSPLLLLAAVFFLSGGFQGVPSPTGFASLGRWTSEEVTCHFNNSEVKQSCDTGRNFSFKCEGIGSCKAKILSRVNQTLTWYGSCGGGGQRTVVDGRKDDIYFVCGTPVREKITCVFKGSNVVQECVSPKGRCSGVGRCIVEVGGERKEAVDWKSSCPGTAKSLMDGRNEFLEFTCLGEASEQVRCVFLLSKAEEECYSPKGQCKGKGSCLVSVRGKSGEILTWRGSCGEKAYSRMDGKNDAVVFKCG